MIELLVVIAIMGLAISVVGPLAMAQLDKFKAKDEVVQLERLLRSAKQNAYLNESETKVTLETSKVVFDNQLGIEREYQFKFINLEPLTTTINRNGFMTVETIHYEIRGEESTLTIKNDGVMNGNER